MPFQAMYRTQRNELFDSYLYTRRSSYLADVISRKNTRQLVKGICKGIPTWYAPDQDFRRERNVFAPFMGIATATITASSRIAAMSGAAVLPYYGYARQDRRPRSARVPITAKVVAKMIGEVGADRVLTVDLHADQIQGFFDVPVDNVYASPILLGDVWRQKYPNLIVVSPDVGGVVRARALAKRLDDADLAIINKRRPKANVAKVMHIIGEVEGRSCVLVDDLVDTAGTLCKAADALKKQGAASVSAYCTHPVLSGNAIENISASALDELVVTDTIPLSDAAKQCKQIRQVSIANMLAETIRRIHSEESVSEMYID